MPGHDRRRFLQAALAAPRPVAARRDTLLAAGPSPDRGGLCEVKSGGPADPGMRKRGTG